MKKFIFILIAVLSSTYLFAAPESAKQYNPDEKVPESSYRILKSDTDSTFNAMLVPLYTQLNGKKFFSIGGGALVEFNPFERVGFSTNGIKSYYSGSWNEDYATDVKASYYEIEAGLKLNIFINNDPSSPVNVVLGSRYTGYNQVTHYYVTCNAPVKKIWALRMGYLRNNMEYTYETDDYYSKKIKVKSILDSVYAGIEWDHIYKVEIEINDVNIERDFGKRFSQSQNFKFFTDALIAVHEGGDDEKNRPIGFRAGITSFGNRWGWGTRIEGGLNPIFGGYFLCEIGICIN